jgi:uncharacterized protein YecE (DUF72 family)
VSYAFNILAPTKQEACLKVAARLALVVQQQPLHAKDEGAALAAVESFINLLPTDITKEVAVSVNGALWENEETGLRQVSINLSASLVDKVPA